MVTAQHTTEGPDQARRTAVPSMVPKAFFVAGLFFVVFAILWGVTALTDADVEMLRNNLVGPVAWTFAFGGLLVLFQHRFFDRSSGWSRAGALFAGIGVLGATVIAVWSLLQLAGIVSDPPAVVEGLVNVAILIGVIPAFVAFSVASFRTAGLGRRWGVLLAAPPVIFIVNIALAIPFGMGSVAADWIAVLAGAGQALAMFAIGHTLRSGDGSPADTSSVDRSTAAAR